MLRGAIEDNVETIQGRVPKRLRPGRRLLHLWARRAWMVAFPVGVLIASVVVARWPASAQGVPIAASAAAAGPASAAPLGVADPWVVRSQVRPDTLALGVQRVIVDAGHGGENWGTSSVGGLLEKDLTLDIAERVQQLIVKRGFKAVMTRTTDDTLSLERRTAIANGRRGDIFVSIHLNSLQPSSARGTETYYLGPSDGRERDAIAATENLHSGYSLADMRSLLERIYVDARRDESRRLAESVQRALVRTLQKAEPAFVDRGVKMAPFVVLVATEMPAILTEVSCLSNAAEAERLKTAEYRQTIADALASGIETFANETRGHALERTGTSGS